MAIIDESKKLENEELEKVSGGVNYYVTCPDCKTEFYGGGASGGHMWLTVKRTCPNCNKTFTTTVEINAPYGT